MGLRWREGIDRTCRGKEIFSTGKTAWSVEVPGLQGGGVDLKNPCKKVKFGGLMLLIPALGGRPKGLLDSQSRLFSKFQASERPRFKTLEVAAG